MAIKIGDNLNYAGVKPDFVRQQYATFADMLAVRDNTMPPIYLAYCLEDKNFYKYDKENEVDPVTGKFRLFQSGGGGSGEDDEAREIATGAMALATEVSDEVDTISSTLDNLNASTLDYDNTDSGLEATNVQDAIDEIDNGLKAIPKAIVAKGTITFSHLPNLNDVEIGWMYNISNNFTTNSDFILPGIEEKAGSNVYCANVGTDESPVKKWDVFAAPAGTTVVVDQTYNPSSENPQSGTAVAQALSNVTTVDTAMSDTSENAVQNKVIKEYVDTQIETAITQVLDTGF